MALAEMAPYDMAETFNALELYGCVVPNSAVPTDTRVSAGVAEGYMEWHAHS